MFIKKEPDCLFTINYLDDLDQFTIDESALNFRLSYEFYTHIAIYFLLSWNYFFKILKPLFVDEFTERISYIMVDPNYETSISTFLLPPEQISPLNHVANLEPTFLTGNQNKRYIVQRRLKCLKCEANTLDTTCWMFTL